MAFETVVKVPGDADTYVFNPALKKYALGDTGFVQNNAGAYIMQRALEPSKGLDRSIKLKVVVDKALSGVKIKTVSPKGDSTVNIFNHKDGAEMVELYHFYLNELVERGILNKH
jgi:hypothetical protein